MSKELKTGIIVLIIIAIGFWGFNFLKGQSIFEATKRHFFVEYDNVEGLSEVSIVTYSGKPVGKVAKIEIQGQGKVLVKFLMDNDIEFSKTSVAKMYMPSMVTGVQNIAIVPKFDGSVAVSGDTLTGVRDGGMLSLVKDQIKPLQMQVEKVLVNANHLISGVNNVLNDDAQKSLNRNILSIESTVARMNKALGTVNLILDRSKENINETFANTKQITDDVSVMSKKISQIDIATTITNFDKTLQGVNEILSKVKEGKGSLGKLMSDDQMYVNLTKASKEMEELLREIKLNPKRFVHFSVFGKKPKGYNKDNNKLNKSN